MLLYAGLSQAQQSVTINNKTYEIPGEIVGHSGNAPCGEAIVNNKIIHLKDSAVCLVKITDDRLIYCELTFCGGETRKIFLMSAARKDMKKSKASFIQKFSRPDGGAYYILYWDLKNREDSAVQILEKGKDVDNISQSRFMMRFDTEEKAKEIQAKLSAR